MSSRARSTRGAKGKEAATAAAVCKDQPYALVLYEKDKTKGVVLSKTIAKKDREKGALGQAPNPIDWQPEHQNSTNKYSAFIIEFGCKYQVLCRRYPHSHSTIN
jgi:hypothetical protein